MRQVVPTGQRHAYRRMVLWRVKVRFHCQREARAYEKWAAEGCVHTGSSITYSDEYGEVEILPDYKYWRWVRAMASGLFIQDRLTRSFQPRPLRACLRPTRANRRTAMRRSAPARRKASSKRTSRGGSSDDPHPPGDDPPSRFAAVGHGRVAGPAVSGRRP